MKLSDLPLDRPVATLMVLVCLTVLGIVALTQLPISFLPTVKEPEVDIEVPFPGSHPLEGLRQVVRPIEEEVATIPDVRSIWGYSRPGFSSVEVTFDWSVNIELKKMEVREAVERARVMLPPEVGHIRVEGDTDGPDAEILGGRISAGRDLSESWQLLDRRIRQPLERVRGVARVNLYGVDPQEVRIDLDLAALKRHGVAVGELIRRIDEANLNLDLGVVRDDMLRYDVRAATRFDAIETARNLDLGVPGVRLRDVASVNLREPELLRGRHLNRDFAIGFDVFKDSSANTVETVRAVEAKLEEIRRDSELQGIHMVFWQNQADEILNSIEGLRNAGILGGLLAISVLWLFLRRISTTLIVGVAIPFSILVTCGAMFVFGLDFNVLTMLGLMLGIGMLVDNAVVVIENIYRLQGQGRPAAEAARYGARQVALAVVAATATTIIVWSWLFVTEPNTMKIYIGQVALVICLSVGCSLLISLTFIPLCAARFVSSRELKQGFLLRRVVPAYRSLLGWTLRHRFLTLFLLFVVAGSAAVPIALIEKTGEPRKQTREVLIVYQVHDPSRLEILEGHVNTVEDWLEAHRDELGIGDIYSWFSEQDNSVQSRVYLPAGKSSEAAFAHLKEQLREGLPTIAGVELEIGEQHGRHHGPRQKDVVRLALHGEDPEYLEQLALEVEARMQELPHVTEVYGPSLVGREEVRVIVDPERARALGVAPRHVADEIQLAFRGQQLRRYQRADDEVEVRVGLHETARPGLSALADLPILTERGETVPLGAVARLELARTPQGIMRWDRKTTSHVAVQFDAEATTTQELRDSMTLAMAGFRLPDGYSWDWGESMRHDDEALGMMLRGVAISLLVVVLLMAALFESFTQPLAILITLPLALFGAFWTLWLFGFVFEVLAFIGVIILIGLVVNNGIVMVDHVNALRRLGRSRHEALIEGCGDRLRPVLMTVITTVVGLLPLLLSQFTVAGLYIQSLAAAMIGGLVSSSIFTLVALPVWYTAVEDLGAVVAGLFERSRRVKPLPLPRDAVLARDDRP